MPTSSKPQNSNVAWLFLINEAALLGIALYTNSSTAYVFFWLGLGILLSRVEPSELRWSILAYWLGLSFGILGYLLAPQIGLESIQRNMDTNLVLGLLFYLAAAIILLGSLYWTVMYNLPLTQNQSNSDEK